MRSSARGWGRGSTALLVLLLLGLAGGCRWWGTPREELSVVQRIPLPESVSPAATLHVDARGRVWLGAEGGLRVMDRGRVVERSVTGGNAAPEVLGRMGERLYARAGPRLFALDPATGRVLAERGDMGKSVLALDPRGRYVYQAAASGAVLGHDPRSLEPEWAWAALGGPATAAAVSPGGDRFYLALADDGRGRGEAAAELLVRDLQTGRVLSRSAFPAPLRELLTDPTGTLYGVVGDEDRGAVLALDPLGGELRIRWRRTLRSLDLPAGAELRYSPAADRLAVFVPGTEHGLHVLSAETGETVGAVRGELLDAVFGAGGALYLLEPGEVRVVR